MFSQTAKILVTLILRMKALTSMYIHTSETQNGGFVLLLNEWPRIFAYVCNCLYLMEVKITNYLFKEHLLTFTYIHM
jgi:hypothetical protein